MLVHGWGHSRIDLLARIEPWQRLCRRVVLYDLRGHGDATGGRTRLGHGEERDLLALLERLDPAPTVLVGHSMGAAIAIRAAASGDASAAGVVGVVAVAPYDDFHRSLRGRLSRSGFPARPMSDIAMAWFRLCGIRHAPIDRAAAQLPCPLLVLHGTADSVAPPEHGERIARAAPAGRYHAVAGAGHLDEHVVDAEGVTAEISRFLDGRAGASAIRFPHAHHDQEEAASHEEDLRQQQEEETEGREQIRRRRPDARGA